ncbi:hypothetical protein DB41_HN00100 [Neochlamydia sp. TUME1]|uniref:hypothetical protein n=1 Tax=Neochlamydia sp. TUME1 TaxID=1478174 RepID=UPI00057E2EE2|nr:hypothetical protein [Neochlamydia sp. TUME1]KIC75378.1 hypothetical protein DB41_HN00100 [Neochlamydia sp. TUME1]
MQLSPPLGRSSRIYHQSLHTEAEGSVSVVSACSNIEENRTEPSLDPFSPPISSAKKSAQEENLLTQRLII